VPGGSPFTSGVNWPTPTDESSRRLEAVELRWPRSRGDEVDLSRAVGRHYSINFPQTGHGFSVEARDLECVTVKMDGVIIGALVTHDQTVALALLQGYLFGF
jgi:hypothetical protein